MWHLCTWSQRLQIKFWLKQALTLQHIFLERERERENGEIYREREREKKKREREREPHTHTHRGREERNKISTRPPETAWPLRAFSRHSPPRRWLSIWYPQRVSAELRRPDQCSYDMFCWTEVAGLFFPFSRPDVLMAMGSQAPQKGPCLGTEGVVPK